MGLSTDHDPSVTQGPQRSITALAPTSSDTFLAGTADGRVLSFHTATGEASVVEGDGHTNLVTAMVPSADGKIISTGYDDRVREIDGGVFTSVFTLRDFKWSFF